MHTYSVRSWENAEREYYIYPDHRYFVTIVNTVTRKRCPEFSRNLPSEQWLKLVIDGNDTLQIEQEIERMLEWHKTVPDGQHIVIHCTEGMTRSPSMVLAMMIADMKKNDPTCSNDDIGKQVFKQLHSQKPLPDCYDSQFELSPRIVESVDYVMDMDGGLAGAFYQD